MFKSVFLAIIPALILTQTALAQTAAARDQIHIVGSGAINLLAAQVAKRLVQFGTFKSPIVETTGTATGFKRFCDGVGVRFPDIVTAARRMVKAEFDLCARNGAGAVVELKLGHDGIVVAQSKKSPVFEISLRDIYLALSKAVPEGNKEGGKLVPNPNRTWKDVNPSLPAVKILVYGPKAGNDTRDIFVERALEGGCKTFPELAKLGEGDAFVAACATIRTDGAWIDEDNSEKIVETVLKNPDAAGIVPYFSFELEQDEIDGKKINGVKPARDTIGTEKYAIARPLFIYVKKVHATQIPGLKEYVAEFVGNAAIGRQGYLVKRGIVPLSEADRAETDKARAALAELKLN